MSDEKRRLSPRQAAERRLAEILGTTTAPAPTTDKAALARDLPGYLAGLTRAPAAEPTTEKPEPTEAEKRSRLAALEYERGQLRLREIDVEIQKLRADLAGGAK